MINTIRNLVNMIAMIASGKYYKKFSLRSGASLACLLMSLSCLVFANANSAVMCYLGAVIMGITFALGTMIPIAMIIRNWFVDRQSTALAITTCGSSLSTEIMPIVITKLVDRVGLKNTFYIEAIFIVLCVIVIFLVIHDNPSDLNMEPYRKARGTDEYNTQKDKVGRANYIMWKLYFL